MRAALTCHCDPVLDAGVGNLVAATERARVVAFGREIRYSVRHYMINPTDTFQGRPQNDYYRFHRCHDH